MRRQGCAGGKKLKIKGCRHRTTALWRIQSAGARLIVVSGTGQRARG